MLELRQIQLLRSIAESGSMTGAAASLAFTPSAVSQQVASLERQLGVSLLVRHARGVRLTEVAQLLVDRGAVIEDHLNRLEQDIADVAALHSGRLRLATFSSAAGPMMAPAMARFRKEYPDVLMTLDVADPGAGVAASRSGAADLALVFDFVSGPTLDLAGIDARQLFQDPMYVALPADHPQAGPVGPIRISDLADSRWVRDSSPDPSCRELLARLTSAAGFQPEIAFESDNYLAIGRLVASGVGIALIPGMALEQLPADVVVKGIEPATDRRVFALVADGAAPATKAMLDILTGVAAEVAA